MKVKADNRRVIFLVMYNQPVLVGQQPTPTICGWKMSDNGPQAINGEFPLLGIYWRAGELGLWSKWVTSFRLEQVLFGLFQWRNCLTSHESEESLKIFLLGRATQRQDGLLSYSRDEVAGKYIRSDSQISLLKRKLIQKEKWLAIFVARLAWAIRAIKIYEDDFFTNNIRAN